MTLKPCAALILLAASVAAAVTQDAAPASPTPDEQLWAQIERLSIPSATTAPYEPRFEAEIDRLERLIARLESYQQQFPGGSHYDDAIVSELTARFHLATLTNRSDGFLARCEELCDRPMSAAARTKLADFTQLARRLADGPAQLADLRQVIATQPTSDRSIASASTGHHGDARPTDPSVSREVAVRRQRAVGKPLTFDADGGLTPALRTAGLCVRPVVIVIWTSADERSLAAAAGVRQLRAARPELGVVSMSIDLDPARMRDAVEAYGLEGVLFQSPRGWADELLATWGLRRLPALIVIDSDGCLIDIREDADPLAIAEIELRLR